MGQTDDKIWDHIERPHWGPKTGPHLGPPCETHLGDHFVGPNCFLLCFAGDLSDMGNQRNGFGHGFGTAFGSQSGPQFGPQSGSQFGPQSGPQFGPQSGPQFGPQSGSQHNVIHQLLCQYICSHCISIYFELFTFNSLTLRMSYFAYVMYDAA